MPKRIPFHQPPHLRAPGRMHEPGRQRLSAHARGYTRKWEKYAHWFLRQPENAVCRGTVTIEDRGSTIEDRCRQPATQVDHIQPVDGPDDPLFWEPTNHQGLCHSCHSRKTAREDGGFGRRPSG